MICQVNRDISSRVAISNDKYGPVFEDLRLSVGVAVDDLSREGMKAWDVRDEWLEEMPTYVDIGNNLI